MKKYYYRLPFWFKLWWAKQFIYMFRGFGPTFNNDITLYNELRGAIYLKPTRTAEFVIIDFFVLPTGPLS